MLSKNPYTEKIIKNYTSYTKDKTVELINDAQKSFDKWKTIDINQRIKTIQIIKSNIESKKNTLKEQIQENEKLLSDIFTTLEINLKSASSISYKIIQE